MTVQDQIQLVQTYISDVEDDFHTLIHALRNENPQEVNSVLRKYEAHESIHYFFLFLGCHNLDAQRSDETATVISTVLCNDLFRMPFIHYLLEVDQLKLTTSYVAHKSNMHIFDFQDVVKFLLEIVGMNVELRTITGKSMLDVAAEFGDLELCKYLIHAQGADPSARSVQGRTAKYYALEAGWIEIVDYFDFLLDSQYSRDTEEKQFI